MEVGNERRVPVLATAAFALSMLASSAMVSFGQSRSPAPKATEIADQVLAALGGQKAWERARYIRFTFNRGNVGLGKARFTLTSSVLVRRSAGRLLHGGRREMKLKRAAIRCIGLGVVSLFAVGVSHLALTDIYHAEGDLGLEWNMLRGCFAVILAFQVYALVTLGRVIRGG